MIKALRTGRFAFSFYNKYKKPLQTHYKKNDYLPGCCTPEDSLAYSQRGKNIHPQHWRTTKGIPEEITVSSLGMGTYNGPPSNEYDYEMFGALVEGIKSGGINMLDTCTLYRFGKSEKVISAVLNYLIKQEGYKREEFMISTKCGYIPQDIDSNLKEEDFIRVLAQEDNILNKEDIVANIHCVAPNFLDFSVEKSRLGLGLQTIDILYLNNFSEAHLPAVGQQVTYKRLKLAFERMEQMRTQNRIKYYGLSSYVGLRSPRTEDGVHFSLDRALKIAKQVGGQNHGFRFLMVPFSLGTPEILLKWQQYEKDGEIKDVRVIDIAQAQNLNIVSCGPLFQGQVVNLPFQSKNLNYLEHLSAQHLQLIRSFPSPTLLTTLVGMTEEEHIRQNLSILPHRPLTADEWKKILPIPQ